MERRLGPNTGAHRPSCVGGLQGTLAPLAASGVHFHLALGRHLDMELTGQGELLWVDPLAWSYDCFTCSPASLKGRLKNTSFSAQAQAISNECNGKSSSSHKCISTCLFADCYMKTFPYKHQAGSLSLGHVVLKLVFLKF